MTRAQPKYHWIADQLRAQIQAGELAAGDRIPGETELMATHKVSRNTVRLAIKRLITEENLLVADQGRGTFVREQPKPFVWNWTTIESRRRHAAYQDAAEKDQWATSVTDAGRVPGQDIQVSIVTPPPAVAERLGVDPDIGIALLRRRVRFVDHEPSLLADSYFPVDLVQGTPLMEPRDVSAPGGVLASLGHIQARYHDVIVPRMPTRREIEMLRLPMATPVAEHTRTGYDKDDRALRVMVTILSGDRHVITYDVEAD
jgi:DNA-binding GntR family transcriptional regulator